LVLSRVVSKHRTILMLCFILIGSLVSITADLRASLVFNTIDSLVATGLHPIHRGTEALRDSAVSVREAVRSAAALRQENKELKEITDSLFSTVVRARELEKENERLRDLLGFARKKGLRFEPVEVIGGDATSWFSTVAIDKRGSREIEKDMCVVTDKGVVGRVLSVKPLTARVLLLSDSNSRVGALVQRTRDRGIVQGNDRGGCLMKYLDPMADVERGDLVVTSGDSLIFPKGLAIGVVTKVERERGDFLKWAEIEPSVEFSRLEEAFVILP